MSSPVRLFLVLALTSISCTLAQLDSTQTQSINNGVFRNNRNPTTTTTTPITILPTITIPSATSQQVTASQATSSASQSLAATTTTLVPEFPQRQKSQILTPLRTNRISTNDITPSQASITTTQSSTTAVPTASVVANDDSGPNDVDPEQEDLCIVSPQQDAYQVGSEWSPNISCPIKCRCVFRYEPIYLVERRWEVENWKPNSYPTEIRCSIPEKCPDISERLVPTINCLKPVVKFPSGSDFESCDCPSVSCASPPGQLAAGLPQRFFPSSVITNTNIVRPSTVVVATTETTTTPPPTTTTTTPTATTTQQSQTTPTTVQLPTTITQDPPSIATITAKTTEILPTTTKLSPKVVAIQSQSPTAATTTTTITTPGATEDATLTTDTDPATTITTTSSSEVSPTIETSRPTTTAAATTTTTSEIGLSPVMSIIQAIEAPLERYAAHLLIALAIMTSLFVFMSFMYLRRAFRSSMVPISDCYENPAFKNRGAVLLIDEADHQNFRNKNKEVDSFSPLGF